MDTIKR